MSDYPSEEFLTACYLNHIDKFTDVTDDDRKAARRAFNAIKAEVWTEGHKAGVAYQGDGWNCEAHDPEEDNPYRKVDV